MKIFLVLSLFLFYPQTAQAKSVTDDLIVTLVDKHLPQILHQEAAKQWSMGTYDLTVTKNGKAVFSSTHKYLSLTLPIKIKVKGRVNKQLLGKMITFNCSSELSSHARLDIEPIIKPPTSKANVEVSVPVPESNLNCDGLIIPIRPVLEQLVANKKQEWQQQLEQDIAMLFTQIGI